MTATATPAGYIVRDGDTEASCEHCRYFTGHTSWCPAVAEEKLADEHAARPARRVNLYTMTAQRIRAEVIGSTVTATVWDVDGFRRRIGRVERVENGRLVVRFPDGTWTYGRSGRVTVH